jgi:ABC-2 type transport system permease protein
MSASANAPTLPARRGLNLEWRIETFRNGLKDATAYQFEFFVEIVSAAFVPAVIQFVLWYSMFQSGGQTTIAGLGFNEWVQYTVVSMLFSQIRGGDLDFELAEMIRVGTLSNFLLRPVGVVEFVYLRGLAPRLIAASFGLIIGLGAGLVTGLISPLHLLAGMFLALIGNVIHYQISAAIAASAFFWEEAYSLLMVKNMVVGILSGEMIPLTLIPENYSWIWKSTPFYLYVFGPTQIALGRWTWPEYFQNLGYAGMWLVGSGLLVSFSWRVGLRKYQSLGG